MGYCFWLNLRLGFGVGWFEGMVCIPEHKEQTVWSI